MRFRAPNRSLRNSPPSAAENRSPATSPAGPLRRHRNPRKSFRRTHRTSYHPGSGSAADKTDGWPLPAALRLASTTSLAEPASFVVPLPLSEDDQITTEVTPEMSFHHALLADF